MRKSVIAAIAMCSLFGYYAAAFGDPQDVRLSVKNGSAVLEFPDRDAMIPLNLYANAAVVDAAKVLFQNTKDSVSFLVIQLDGPSRLNGGGGYCGAGTETNLIWMKVDSARILDLRTVLCQSCVFSIERDDADSSSNATSMVVRYVSYREHKRFNVSYDNQHPENGFAITTEPLPADNGAN